jgi:hypothetical protein
VGRTGRFVPVDSDKYGGKLLRVKDDKQYAVTGSKGHLWMEQEDFNHLDALSREGLVDMSYFHRLADEAKATIEKFGSFEEFVS